MKQKRGFAHLLILILVVAAIVAVIGVIIVNNQNEITNNSVNVASIASPVSTILLPPEVNNTSLYYVADDMKLYKKSPLNASPVVFLDKVDSYAFSPDRKKIAFIKEYGLDTDNNVYVKNLETGQIEVNIGCGKWCVNRSISWSPKGTYILVDSGTGPEGTLTVYKASDGEELSQFGDGHIVWENENIIYMDYRTDVNPPREWGSGEGRSIAKVDITSGEADILVAADAKYDYGASKIDNTCLIYSSLSVESDNLYAGSPYCYDLNTGEITSVSLSGDIESDKQSAIEEAAIKQVVPDYATDKSSRVTRNEKVKDWVIMGIHKRNTSIYDSKIVIFSLSDPKSTYQQLGTGDQVDWY